MEILYLLIPLAVLIAVAIVVALLWAVRSGQFEDLEGPAHRILMDDDRPATSPDSPETGQTPDTPAHALDPTKRRR